MRKILYLMDRLDWGDKIAGTEGQFLQLLTHLDRDRFEPHLALFRPSPFTSQVNAFPCPIRVLHVGKLVHPRAALQLARLGWMVRSEGFDLVHIFLNDASIAAPLFCRLGGARVMVSRRDMGFWYTKGNLAALRVSNLFVSKMIANSDAVRRNVHAREAYPEKDIDVFFNGHDPTRFDAAPLPGLRERLGIGPSDPIVGMVANFNSWKRHVDLVHAFAQVRRQHPTAHLVLVGTGTTEPSRQAARTAGIESVVHFLGDVADAVPVVKHFTVGILCSESEGLSNAVMEYMGAGTPAVCTNVGGNVELIRDGESGMLVSPGDVDGLAARIDHLLATPALREQIGRRAAQVARRFTIQRMADAHMDLYERLASPRRTAADSATAAKASMP